MINVLLICSCTKYLPSFVWIDVVSVVDHLVNNAGIGAVCMFEEVDDMEAFRSVMVFSSGYL